MSELRGPADADHFRERVGRFNERWYIDNLPGCEIADADPDWKGPSWTTVKGAAGKDWSFVANQRNAAADADELHRIADLDPTQRAKAFNAINDNGLKQAGGRGTIIHLWAEDMLNGKSPRQVTDMDLMAMQLPKAALEEALLYLPALTAVFDTYQPKLYAAEYVAIHRTLNGVGYGCTPDALVEIERGIVGIDWKSRTMTSKHGAYPEEGAQIAAGARAEYVIVDDGNGGAKRALLPKVDMGLVVSIKPDGARIYPIDLDGAWKHVEAMHAFWVARQDERSFIGRVWPTKTKTAAGDSDARQATESPAEPLKEKTCPDSTPTTSAKGTSRPSGRTTSISTTHVNSVTKTANTSTTPTGTTSTDGSSTSQSKASATDLDLTGSDVKAKVAELVQAGHADAMKAAWPFRPDGTLVPTFKAGGHQDGDMALILEAVRKVQAQVSAPFDVVIEPNPQPRVEADPEPVVEGPDEGGTLDDATVTDLRARFQGLPAKRAEVVAEIARDANAVGRSISVSTSPTVRRGAIAEALIAWATSPASYDDLWAAVSLAATEDQTTDGEQRLGELLSRFSIDQAERLGDTFRQSAAA